MAASILAAFPTPVASQASKPGCELVDIDVQKFGGAPLLQPQIIQSANGRLDAALDVAYATNDVAGCQVKLRSYNGKLAGPTLRAKPGDTLYIKLNNGLPPEPHGHGGDHNIPHGFNTTNLHTHGLHVSPIDKSDNVFREIGPGQSFDYVIEVPKNHAPGSFWYHAHLHGSTALQVSSGMAGMLIIEGGVDDLPNLKSIKQQVLIFQQLSYDAQGVLESYDSFGPGGWDASKRHITINGQIVPEIKMRPGEIQRWRTVHAGVRETINLQLDGHLLNEIAVDGLTLGKIAPWSSGLTLQPGYRSDILVKANPLLPGQARAEYFLRDLPLSAGLRLQAVAPTLNVRLNAAPLQDKTGRLLAKIVVEGEPANDALPSDSDLAANVPLKPIDAGELTGEPQSVNFNVTFATCSNGACQPCTPIPTCGQIAFTVNNLPYDDNNVRKVKLGTAAEWIVSTDATSLYPRHPFHIHVNPFMHTRIGPGGLPENVWRDTLIIEKGRPERILTRYEDYKGKFVLHCHILDHEDQGMMQAVEIVD
jgi:FtsP/CotA-like multicopper oxidase with cupredoxin domain